MDGLFGAANNTQWVPTGKKYTWGTHDPSNAEQVASNSTTQNIKTHKKRVGGTEVTIQEGTDFTEVSAGADLYNRKVALAEKLTEDVQKLHSVKVGGWVKIFYQTDDVMRPSVITSTVIASVSFSSTFLLILIICKMESPYSCIFFGVVFSILGLIPIFTCLISGNNYDKTTLKGINSSDFTYKYRNTGTSAQNYRFKPRDAGNSRWQTQGDAIITNGYLNTDLDNGDHITTAKAPKVEMTNALDVNGIIRANIIVSFGIFSLVIVFGSVLLFSFVIFCKDENSLAAPLFLFTFIITVTVLVFGGIAISSAIAVFHLHSKGGDQGAATSQANTCSWVLLM